MITNWATNLYITPWDRTVSPIFSRTLAIIPHRLRDFRTFWYTAAQLLLLYTILLPRYEKASNSGRASALIWNKNLLTSK